MIFALYLLENLELRDIHIESLYYRKFGNNRTETGTGAEKGRHYRQRLSIAYRPPAAGPGPPAWAGSARRRSPARSVTIIAYNHNTNRDQAPRFTVSTQLFI